MSDIPETTPQAGADQQAQAQAAVGSTPIDSAELERIKKELADVRKEAAGYRTKLRDQEQATQTAEQQRLAEQGNFKTLYEQAQQRLADVEKQQAADARAATLDRIAREAGLLDDAGKPDADLLARLRGDDEAALLADAKALAARLSSTGATPNGGKRDNAAPPAFDPKNPPRLSGLFKRS